MDRPEITTSSTGGTGPNRLVHVNDSPQRAGDNDAVRGVDDFADFGAQREERDDLVPGRFPLPLDRRVVLPDVAIGPCVQCLPRRLLRRSAVDLAERRGRARQGTTRPGAPRVREPRRRAGRRPSCDRSSRGRRPRAKPGQWSDATASARPRRRGRRPRGWSHGGPPAPRGPALVTVMSVASSSSRSSTDCELPTAT